MRNLLNDFKFENLLKDKNEELKNYSALINKTKLTLVEK